MIKGCREDFLKLCGHGQNIPRQGMVRPEEATAGQYTGGLLEKIVCWAAKSLI